MQKGLCTMKILMLKKRNSKFILCALYNVLLWVFCWFSMTLPFKLLKFHYGLNLWTQLLQNLLYFVYEIRWKGLLSSPYPLFFLCLGWPWSPYVFSESCSDGLTYGLTFTSRRIAENTSPAWLPVLSNLTSVYCLGLTQLCISPAPSPLFLLLEILESCCVIFQTGELKYNLKTSSLSLVSYLRGIQLE